jgi:hypothetical protein
MTVRSSSFDRGAPGQRTGGGPPDRAELAEEFRDSTGDASTAPHQRRIVENSRADISPTRRALAASAYLTGHTGVNRTYQVVINTSQSARFAHLGPTP